jgi:beta-lactamase regulating signal transducer with metallopeptidase domain
MLPTPAPPLFRQVLGILNSLAPWIFVVWISGAAVSLLRLFRGWLFVRHLKTWKTTDPPAEWQTRFKRLASLLCITLPVQLRSSNGTVVPCLVGWLKPVVLVPAAAFSGMDPSRLEAILTHELAHIRRNDYPVSVLQGIAEAIYFYHPAVWWASDQVRVVREQCCDDIAVRSCGSVSTYVLALADLEESRQVAHALAVTGGGLAGRVRRLLGVPEPQRMTPPFAGLLSALVLLTAIAGLTVAQTPSMAEREKTSVARETTPSRDELLVRLFDESKTLQAKKESISRLSGSLSPAAWAKLVAIAERDADLKVREEAISYLAGRANETAVRELIRLYDSSGDQAIRLHLLSYLSGLTFSPAAKGKVAEIARIEKDPEIRAKAIDYVLGR